MTRSARRTGRTSRMLRTIGLGAAALLTLSACSFAGESGEASGTATVDGDGLSGTVNVFAAASLTESFTALGKTFEDQHPGTKVVFNFGGSDSLAAGITSGAPADVFASASPRTMKVVTDAGAAAGAPAAFATNRLEIATLPGNPEGIGSLKDLTARDLKVVLCDRAVPCGAAAEKALDAAGLELKPVSYEEDVKSALNKVVLKEADAALVYRTDVRAAGDKVVGVEFPESGRAVNDYPITLLKDAPNSDAAEAFIELVRSPEGLKVLTGAGFGTP
ncbi:MULTISPECIES: molybdate ABC transporter substrate-binding protein [unclassified Streptomyces]|uniref:molybdate ABC transporter substrate-binding protein n=1 Tax=unclassified Streptomyces TaxID=2593676 RepID=UPI002237B64F|nr:molybdate ABC transporter substrate-binding protein [Streptomyces sp. SHP 1-2]MCW5251994.1 molybdate ABC transporter substrate-binding protein [Streptomyces sp. SHP 1-2]